MNRNHDLPANGQPSAARVVAAMPLMSMIVLQEQASLRYWCRLLGATPLEICRAVASVGSNPAAVRAHLRQRNDPIRLRPRRVRRTTRAVPAMLGKEPAAAVAVLGLQRGARSIPPHGRIS